MVASTMGWKNEMQKMLTVFDSQATISLGNIKKELKRNGLSFNAEFKQYFLRTSFDRIKTTYNQFEIDSMFEEQIDDASSSNGPQMPSSILNNSYYLTDPVEIFDSNDEEDRERNQIKLASTDIISALQYTNEGETSKWYDDDQIHDDGSNSDMKSSSFDEMELNDLDRDVDIKSENSSTLRHGSNISPNQLKMKKRFKCQLCDYCSDYNWLIKRHMRSHTGEKPHRCEVCQKGFARMEQLKRHKVTHKNKTPFHCRGCFTGFSQEADQEAHEKECKIRRYECLICKKYVTLNKISLKMHMRKHSGERPFKCEICMKCFKQKSHLKTHLYKIHTRINH